MRLDLLPARSAAALCIAILGSTGCDRPPRPLSADGGVNVVGMNMIPVEGNAFLMGTPRDQGSRDFQLIGEELHEVVLSRDFLVASTEVTERQWKLVTGRDVERPRGDNYAATRISWHDAAEFCNLLSERAGLQPAYRITGDRIHWTWESNGYRLPTEAEWEFVARAGTTSLFSFGDELAPPFHDYTLEDGALPVDALPPNPWGLHGVHTGAWEWCWDWFGRYPRFSVTDPIHPITVAADSQRVVRGGGTCDYVNGYVRSAYRNRFEAQANYNDNLGVRPVRFVDALEGAADSEESPASLGSLPGRLTIETPMPRILVAIDEKDLYLTPVHNLSLSPGNHIVRIVDPEYRSEAETFVAESSVTGHLFFDPEPLRGQLLVSAQNRDGDEVSEPLFIDGRSVGSTPWAGALRPGGRQVRIGESTLGITVTADDTTRAVVHLPTAPRTAVGMGMRAIPAGIFVMGSARWEEGHARDEQLHVVQIRRPFLASEGEVTQGQWAAVMGESKGRRIGELRGASAMLQGTPAPSDSAADRVGNDLPMIYVSWFDAVEFCNRLSLAEGFSAAYQIDGGEVQWERRSNGYRLPTEAEWEYMARAGTRTRFWSGEGADALAKVDWVAENAEGRPHPVASLPANPWGLHDLHGNVWEWCWNWYTPYDSRPWLVDPAGPDHASAAWPNRASRGSGWSGAPWTCRIANRNRDKPHGESFRHVGFRVVRTLWGEGFGAPGEAES